MSKTMIDSKVIETAKFLDLKPSTRDLYTHLMLASDDEGYVANPKGIARYIGAKESDLAILINEGYLLEFPTKVILIIHYWVHNNHDKHNNRPTIFTEEKALVYEDESHVYRLKESIEDKTDNRLNTDCKEPTKEPTYKERTNQPTKIDIKPVRLVGLSDNSIYYSLSDKDRGSLQEECHNHSCDLVKLIQAIDITIINRKEQTEIKNRYRYIIQIAQSHNWNPGEINKSFLPVISSSEKVVKHYKDIEGSLWDKLNENQRRSMKVQFNEDKDIKELIKDIDTIIKENPEEEYTGTEVNLFMNLAKNLI